MARHARLCRDLESVLGTLRHTAFGHIGVSNAIQKIFRMLENHLTELRFQMSLS